MRFFLNRKIILTLSLVCGLFFSVHQTEAGTLVRPPNNLGLVGYWSFNEGTSTVATDYSGNGNNGTLTNIAAPATDVSGWAPTGKFSSALTFDGSNDYVSVGGFADAIFTNSWSQALWIKGTTTSNLVLTEKGTNNAFIQTIGVGQIRVGATGASAMNTTGSPAVNDGSWHHITVTYDGGTNSLITYIDGAVRATSTASSDSASSATAYSIGSRLGSAAFPGQIDEVRVYNRVLTAAQVSALYNSGASKFGGSNALTQGTTLNDGLVGHWTFDGKDTDWRTNTTRDVSGQNNTGTLVNLPTSTAPVSGKFGQALNFDRNTANYVQLASTSATSMNTNLTLSAWVNADNSDCCRGIIAKGSTYGTIGPYRLLTGYAGLSNAYLRFDIGDGVSAVNVAAFPGASATLPNMWHHAVCNTDTTTMSCYWDGVFIASSSRASIGSTFTGDSWFALGTLNPNQMYYGGRIDDVRIYNRVLSAAEIKQLYSLGSGKANASSTALSQGTTLKDGLVGLWTFDGTDTISSITDRSGQGNNGQFIGSATSSAKRIGKLGQALNFDSLNNRIALSATTSLTTFTMSTWFRTSSTSQISILFGDSAANTNGGNKIAMNGGNFFLRSGGVQCTSVTVPTDTNWHQVTVTRNDTNSWVVYKDGVANSSCGTNPGNATFNLNTLGANGADSSQKFDGVLDDMRIYNRSLTAAEAKQLYQMGQ